MSCEEDKSKQTAIIDKDSREKPDFSKGVMDEKILWYLGRLGNVDISPDGSYLVYAVTYFDYTKNNYYSCIVKAPLQ